MAGLLKIYIMTTPRGKTTTLSTWSSHTSYSMIIITGDQRKKVHYHTESRLLIRAQIEVTVIETMTTSRKMQPATNLVRRDILDPTSQI